MHNLKKVIFVASFMLISVLALTQKALAATVPPVLDQVLYSLSVEDWVKTDTAKVIVTVDAALSKEGLEKSRQNIMGKLNKIAKGDWNITRFDRSQDQSGLERLTIVAEMRVVESQLNNLRSNAKSVSIEGETYRIADIEFVPSLADVERVSEKLRDDIYHKANAELARLNQAYPEQKYTLNQINFSNNMLPNLRIGAASYGAGANIAMQQNIPTEVSNKLTLSASIVLAAQRGSSNSR